MLKLIELITLVVPIAVSAIPVASAQPGNVPSVIESPQSHNDIEASVQAAPDPVPVGTTAGAPAVIMPGQSAKSGRTSAPLVPELKQTIKSLDRSKNYSESIHKQHATQQVGSFTVVSAPPEQLQADAAADTGEQFIQMERPQLMALISVNRNVNPFALDSNYQERVTMRDVLMSVSGANLDILRSVASLQTQRWNYLNSLTDYLPSINLGFNEIGLNSTAALPIQSTAVVPAGQVTGSGLTAATTVNALATKTVIQTPLTVLNSGFTWKPFQGGQPFFSVLYQKHQLKAAKSQLRGDISDVLLSTANDYYDLIFNEALLQIRTAAMETSEEQVRQNTSLEGSGLATNLDILQAKTQLSKDRQNLLEQQRLRRAAAIKLAHDLNINLGQDLLPAENTLRRVRLISPDLSVNQLLSIAVDNRPELKQYEELRLAAKKQIAIAASDVLPTVSLGGNIIGLASNIGTMEPTFLLNFGVTWKFDGLGLKAATSMQASRWQARNAMLEANQQLLNVVDQVRNAYNRSLTTERAVDESTNEVASAREELRLSRMRLDHGLGTNLEVLTAQRDLTGARLDKALSLMNFNKAQAQLLHDIGLISIDNLSAGLLVKPKID